MLLRSWTMPGGLKPHPFIDVNGVGGRVDGNFPKVWVGRPADLQGPSQEFLPETPALPIWLDEEQRYVAMTAHLDHAGNPAILYGQQDEVIRADPEGCRLRVGVLPEFAAALFRVQGCH